MICLSDSDFVIKLAEFDLLAETLDVLDVERADVRVPPELENVLQGNRILQKHTRTCIQRAQKFIKGLKPIKQLDRSEHVQLMAVRVPFGKRQLQINDGEAVLYSSTKFITDFLIATGDKSSLRALAMSPACSHVHERLRGRVICLEQTLLKIMDKHGFKHVQKKVGAYSWCDECVLQAFANGKASMTEEDCREWLHSFVDKLRTDTNGLLVS